MDSEMLMETRAWVIDKDNKILILFAEIIEFLSKDYKGPKTHVLLKYYIGGDDTKEENKILEIFPIDRCYFSEIVVPR